MFRIKLLRRAQRSLFDEGLTRRDLILQGLLEKPSMELKNGHQWHIGNVRLVDDDGGYFAVGRTTKSILETYDEEKGDFVEEQLETSPYTHVLFDRAIGFIAVAKKSKLGPNAESIARRVADLLREAEATARNGVDVSVDPISDPYDFVESLKGAYAIRSFEATFGRPNPFDADELFLQCSEGLLEAADAKKGKTQLSGESLNSRALIAITHSVAATGNQASARIVTEEGGAPIKKKLGGNPARFEVAEDEFNDAEALSQARSEYRRVRSADDATN
jgi:hypothetical protein